MTTPTQQDIEAAAPFMDRFLDGSSFSDDRADLSAAFMRHRLAAEQAQRERDARIAEVEVSQHDGTFRGLRKAIAAAIRGDEA